MAGHGWVIPNKDGSKARCGGPAVCTTCAREIAAVVEAASFATDTVPIWDQLLPMTSQLYGVVLDIGCGNGQYSRMLRALPGITDVWSADIEPGAPLYAYQQDVRANVRYDRLIQADIQDLRQFAAGQFDCVMSWHTIEHVDRPDLAMAEVRRVARDLVMWALPQTGRGAFDTPEHKRWWTPEAFLVDCLAAGFRLVEGPLIDSTGCQNWLFTVRPAPQAPG